ncbi:MAG: hypothetical protein ACK4TB_05635 [Gemmobacter sp.]
MTDIAGYEARITAALGRLALALDRLGPGAAAPAAEGEGLAAALEAERTANAQLAERVRALRARQDATVAALEARIAELTQAADAQALEMQRIRQVNTKLRDALRALRAAAEGASDPALIDRAMAAELEALHAARSAEIAEMDDILAALDPVVVQLEAAAAEDEDTHART